MIPSASPCSRPGPSKSPRSPNANRRRQFPHRDFRQAPGSTRRFRTQYRQFTIFQVLSTTLKAQLPFSYGLRCLDLAGHCPCEDRSAIRSSFCASNTFIQTDPVSKTRRSAPFCELDDSSFAQAFEESSQWPAIPLRLGMAAFGRCLRYGNSILCCQRLSSLLGRDRLHWKPKDDRAARR